jgi:tetratricopeptide (TPR) repeat protein
MAADDSATALAAVRESVELALEAEGPSGGPLATGHLDAAWQYYAARYSAYEPAPLATEVHLTRALVAAMLRQAQSDADRTELRRSGGFLSALAGNLAFHLGDAPAAQIHLSTAARLGTACGDARLTCWSLGAQSMTARAQRRPAEALDLARQAIEHAATPLQRAQVLSWAELPALVGLGPQHRSDALRVIAEAQDQMSADPDGAQPGRFGFDNAELELHIAEASLVLGDHALARAHAQQSQAATSPGRPSWAAATLTLARAEAARGRYPDAAALAHAVLDEIPAASLRETSRARLRALDRDLATAATADPGSRDLAERLRALPSLVPVGRLSDEPNGTH